MKITIEPTGKLGTIDGVPCRLWHGTTEQGNPVDVYIRCVVTSDPAAQQELDGVQMLLRSNTPKSLSAL
jgi:hypothetical protein